MEELLLWGLGLMGLGVLLLAADMFVPSGGILSIVAGVCALAGIVVLFRHDTAWGVTGLLFVVIMTPMAGVFMVKVWPHTPMGRAVFGTPTEEEVQKRQMAEEAERDKWAALVGREAVVLSDLRPIGVIELDGKRYDALCETTLVRAGQKVRVTVADAMQIKVRPVA